MAKHFTIGGYPNPDPHYISPEEENEILEAEYATRDFDYECQNCIGMMDQGCYCKTMGALRPGGPAHENE